MYRRRLVWILPISLCLNGCASTPTVVENYKPDERVVGSGSDDVRSTITDSNQKIFNTEHAMSTDLPTNQDVP